MEPDRFRKVPVRGRIAGDALAEPWQPLERIEIVGALKRLPHPREFKHHDPAAAFENARHLSKRRILVGHVAKPKADRDAVEIAARKGQPLGIALHGRRPDSCIEEPVAPALEHPAVEVGKPYLAGRTDAPRESTRKIAASSGHIEHAFA